MKSILKKQKKYIKKKQKTKKRKKDYMAEWLRRWTANPLGSARAGSNPVVVVKLFFY